MSDDRMYCVPYAEIMHTDPTDVWELQIDWTPDHGPVPEDGWIIEEWTVRPVVFLGDYADTVAERVGEDLCDESEWTEDGMDAVSRAAGHPDVVAAFQEALDLLCSKVTYRMADEKVAEHRVTVDAEGEPIMNGERMFS